MQVSQARAGEGRPGAVGVKVGILRLVPAVRRVKLIKSSAAELQLGCVRTKVVPRKSFRPLGEKTYFFEGVKKDGTDQDTCQSL